VSAQPCLQGKGVTACLTAWVLLLLLHTQSGSAGHDQWVTAPSMPEAYIRRIWPVPSSSCSIYRKYSDCVKHQVITSRSLTRGTGRCQQHPLAAGPALPAWRGAARRQRKQQPSLCIMAATCRRLLSDQTNVVSASASTCMSIMGHACT
jgi:hypothetical protein